MTREEAIRKAIDIVAYLEAHFAKSKEAREELVEIIEILEQEPCEDAISRQAVLKIIDGWYDNNRDTENIEDLIILITYMSSVTPQQRTGRWIPLEYDGYADGNPVWDKWECSKCGWEHSGDEESLTAFCPDCGIKMGR